MARLATGEAGADAAARVRLMVVDDQPVVRRGLRAAEGDGRWVVLAAEAHTIEAAGGST